MGPQREFSEGLRLALDPGTAELAQKIYDRCRTAITDTVGAQPAQVRAAHARSRHGQPPRRLRLCQSLRYG